MARPDISRPVRTVDLWSVLVIAPAVAAGWIWWVDPMWFSHALLVGVAVAGAATFGVTTWAWAADHGWTRLSRRLLLGAVAGLGPSVTVLLAAALGLLWRDGIGDTRQLFGLGAPIPGYGPLPWPAFLSFTAQCSGVGAVSGAIHWALVSRRSARA